MGEYLQELQEVANALRRLPGLLTAIIILQVLMLLSMAAMTWMVARMASAIAVNDRRPPAPTPAHLKPFAPQHQPTPPYGAQPPYQQGPPPYYPQP